MGTIPNKSVMGDGAVSPEVLAKVLPQEKLEEAIVQQAATSRGVADPLPGPMLDAVVNQELEVVTSKGKVVFRPVVVYDFTIFKKINSPHYRTMLEKDNAEELKTMNIEDEELYEMIYQFTHTCKEIRNELKKGREHFREIATEEIGDKYDINDLNILLQGVATQIQKGFSTMMAHGAKEEDENKDGLDEALKKK